MDSFSQIIGQVSALFRKMSPMQRTNFFLLVAIVTALAVMIGIWSGKTDFSALYSNLSQKDAAAVKAKLDEMKVENRVEGTTIYVPSKAVYETRLLLANEGLPQSSGVGYEIFGKSSFAMTDYMQQLNYKRALEGELSRTINSLKGISGSRVHLAIPKKGLFDEEGNRPTASVVLEVSQSYPLSKQQIGGIAHLVASSVEGLSPDNVSVVDSKGALLFGSGDSDGQLGLSSSQLEMKKNVENYLEKKAESMLTTITGAGKALVRISASINFERVEKTAEKYDPEGAVPRVETRTEEKVTENSGAPAAEASAGAAASAGKNAEKTQEKTTTNYEISKTIERTVLPVGSIQRLNIAVVVDGTYRVTETGEGKDKTVKKEYVPRTQEEKDMYRKLVANAVGFDEARGDKIEVSDASFESSIIAGEDVAADAGGQKDFISGLVKQAGSILLLVMAFVFLMSMLKKFSSALPQAAPFEPQAQPQYAAPGAAAPSPAAAVQAAARPAPGKPAPAPAQRTERQIGSEEELRQVAAQEPEAVAGVVKEWLAQS